VTESIEGEAGETEFRSSLTSEGGLGGKKTARKQGVKKQAKAPAKQTTKTKKATKKPKARTKKSES
jgi:hypothetical protein